MIVFCITSFGVYSCGLKNYKIENYETFANSEEHDLY